MGRGMIPRNYPDPDRTFLKNPCQRRCRFLEILSIRPAHFLKSSALNPIIFENPQQRDRSFFGIASLRPDVFRKRAGGIVRSCPALETDPEDGGCRPHTPTREERRRPRRGAPAAGNFAGEGHAMRVICPQRGSDEVPERLRAKRGGGGIADVGIAHFSSKC